MTSKATTSPIPQPAPEDAPGSAQPFGRERVSQDRTAGGDHHPAPEALDGPADEEARHTRAQPEDERTHEEAAAADDEEPPAPAGGADPRRDPGHSVERHEDRGQEPELRLRQSETLQLVLYDGHERQGDGTGREHEHEDHGQDVGPRAGGDHQVTGFRRLWAMRILGHRASSRRSSPERGCLSGHSIESLRARVTLRGNGLRSDSHYHRERAAAAEAVLAMRANGYDGEIRLFADNRHAPYNPMLGTYLVAGKIPLEQAFPFGDEPAFYGANRVSAHLGEPRDPSRRGGAGRDHCRGRNLRILPLPGCHRREAGSTAHTGTPGGARAAPRDGVCSPSRRLMTLWH